MPDAAFRLLDPEYVLPSAASAGQLEFWDRMLGQADDRSSKVGPATLEGLMGLMDAPPPGSVIAKSDFLKAMSHFMSRGFTSSQAHRSVCGSHISGCYQPLLGHSDNVDRLMDDMRSVSFEGPLVVCSPVGVWNLLPEDCIACDLAPVIQVTPNVTSAQETHLAAIAWRAIFQSSNPTSMEELQSGAERMFPRIKFHPDAWSRTGTLVGDANENVPKLFKHLSVLNDFASEIWAGESDTTRRQSEMSSHGATCSPESSNTRRDTKKIRHRDFVFDGSKIRCEWHTKLRPNVNRIHFAIENGKVYVGAILDHLPV